MYLSGAIGKQDASVMQQQQQPGGPVPTYRNVQGVRTEPPNQRTTYNVQRTTYGTYSVLSIPAFHL